ncbi:hypothetical protein [Streptomyces sp. NPDC040750]|uniref:hypothetical protein n=1 Tax=Streptomyces sp. NPDC040750 TaxID=3154491 RepID=UPI0033D2A537
MPDGRPSRPTPARGRHGDGSGLLSTAENLAPGQKFTDKNAGALVTADEIKGAKKVECTGTRRSTSVAGSRSTRLSPGRRPLTPWPPGQAVRAPPMYVRKVG